MIAVPDRPDFSDLSDDVRAAQCGNRDAFERLYTTFLPRVRRRAMRILGDPNDADELAQRVLVRAWEKLDQLRNAERFPGWLMSIMRHMLVDFASHHHVHTADKQLLDWLEDQTPSPIDTLIAEENATRVHACMERLSPFDRRTLIGQYVEGQSLRQQSAEDNVPIGTMKRRRHDARIRLRTTLEAPLYL